MIPIYWINLNNRSDRRKYMLEQFNNFNLTNHIRIQGEKEKFQKGMFNCMYSHYKALYTAYLDNVDFAMIVEDDINIYSNTIESVAEIIKLLPEDWECFQVHYIDNLLINHLIENETNNRIVKGYLMSTACYIVNRKGIEKFINLMGKDGELEVTFLDNAEAEEFVFRYVNTYLSLYPICNTDEKLGSDILNNLKVEKETKSKKINYDNMILTQKFLELKKDYKIFSNIIELPYDRHYFYSVSEIEKLSF